MALSHLHCIDPEANMARFYCIDVAATLFGGTVLRTGAGLERTGGRVSDLRHRRRSALYLRQKAHRLAGHMRPPDLVV
jgi:predicted DNA-binding WGR domain protein